MRTLDRTKLRKDGEAALVWLVLLLVGMVATAATFAGVIRQDMGQVSPSVSSPALIPGRLSPAPPPLPRPGPSQNA